MGGRQNLSMSGGLAGKGCIVCTGNKFYLLLCEKSHPGKAKIMTVDEHILNKHVWSTTMLHMGRGRKRGEKEGGEEEGRGENGIVKIKILSSSYLSTHTLPNS